LIVCQELEAERESRLRVEQELKLIRDALEKEKERKKEIILLLLAERKKIIGKLVEERKKTEDLVQVSLSIVYTSNTFFFV